MKSARPKVLHRVLGLPLLEHVRRAVAAVGADPVTAVVGHQAEAVREAFAPLGLHFVHQEPQKGTGHAVQCAREEFAARPERTLLVLNGDLPLLRGETLGHLLEVHRARRAAATLLTVVLDDPGAYGRVLRSAENVAHTELDDGAPEPALGVGLARHLAGAAIGKLTAPDDVDHRSGGVGNEAESLRHARGDPRVKRVARDATTRSGARRGTTGFSDPHGDRQAVVGPAADRGRSILVERQVRQRVAPRPRAAASRHALRRLPAAMDAQRTAPGPLLTQQDGGSGIAPLAEQQRGQ